jgi:hypothetical protein
VAEAIGAGLGSTEIISVEKSAGQAEEVIASKRALPGEELIDVDRVNDIRPSQLACMGGLIFTVDPVARQHYDLDFTCHLIL